MFFFTFIFLSKISYIFTLKNEYYDNMSKCFQTFLLQFYHHNYKNQKTNL